LIAALLVLGFADAGTTDRTQAQEKGRGRDKASPARPDDKGARVDEAMRISGVRSHLALVRIRMKQILDEDARVDYDARRWLAQTLDAAFSPEAFARPIRQALLDGYDGGLWCGTPRPPVGSSRGSSRQPRSRESRRRARCTW
jgi:hypothetical protein